MMLCAAAVAGAHDEVLPATIGKIKPSIVGVGTVQMTRNPPAELRGTGFAVGDGRHVITNAHVLPEAMDVNHREYLAVFVGTGDAVARRRAEKVAVDADHDLVLLKIEGPALPALGLSDGYGVREGQIYAFTGFPIGAVLGMFPATHHGMIASITPIVTPARRGRELRPNVIKRMRDPYHVFQLDATAYPGNSGSPVYDIRTGEVIGVINKVFVKGTKENALKAPSGITYAIPARYARELLNRVLPEH